MAGWRLRGYTVERLLGRGASSEVWRARVAGTGESVALKRLFVTDDEQVGRARAEAAILSVLDHPNLVRLHAIVPTAEATVLVLDLAEGGSLADLLSVRGRLTAGEVITAIAPVAAALAYVHRSGVIHGDVSAANLLFTPGGVSLLADLGVARLTGDERDAESTPAYIDPIVARGSVPAAPSDVFMLGAVALHALTGTPLWPAENAEAALTAACSADVSTVPSRLAAAGVPDDMAAVVLRALVVDPVRRSSAADFALDLRHSGTPVAIELRAGRPGPDLRSSTAAHLRYAPPGSMPIEPPQYGQTSPRLDAVHYRPRHADRSPTGAASGRNPDALADATDDGGVEVVGAPPPTSAIRRPRPEIPRRPPRRVSRRHVLTASAVAAVLGGAAAFLLLTPAHSLSREHDVAGTIVPTRRVNWTTTLRKLDDARAEAFADRDPSLLANVYVAGELRTDDATLLARLVPAGCSLSGAATTYESIRVRPTPDDTRAVITTRASIPTSVLHCSGRPDRPVPAVPTTPIRLDLVTTPDGPRIAAQRAG